MNDRPGIEVQDRYGNRLWLCSKCNVPVVLWGAAIKCLNGCHLGDLDYRNEAASEQNRFNPLVTKVCSKCGGDGKTYAKEDDAWCAAICDQCAGQGVYLIKKYKEDDGSTQILIVDDEGWTQCPKCNFRFHVRDKNVWMENRHRRCGQKLVIPDE